MDISPAAVDETNCAFEIESKSTIRTYLDTYFNKSDIADCVFLHRATTISEWTQGKLEKTLLKAICASALRLTPGYDAEISPAHKWISQVQNELTNQMGDLSIPKLQSLVLVVEFLFSMQFTGDVWVLVSIASRIAFTKRLNYERPAIDAIKQECLRRLMWSIYRIDKVFSGGIEDLTVCPTQRMHIRLPSSQHNFQLGSRSKAPFLWSKSEDGTDLNVLAFLMRMYDIRDRVLRFLIPGIREAVSPEAMNQTPREYTDYCQQRCLQTSLKYIEMWFIIRQMETNSRVGTPTSAVVTYQMVKIIDHLAGLLPLNGDTSLLAIKQRLVDILPVVSGGRSGVGWTRSCSFSSSTSKTSYHNWEQGMHRSARRRSPVMATITANSLFSSTSPGTIRQQEKLHRRSKHAYAPEDEEEEDPAIRPSDQNTSEELSATTTVEIPSGQDIWSFTTQGTTQDLTGSTGDGSFETLSSLGYPLINYDSINSIDMVFGDQELGFPMDPFDLQMNAYTDSNAPQY
ncbi:hypothetical protein FIE12Z_1748 [Fusarium flagelliforme]|uniref:Xylanolytic transcriptional activator regulatory domain-containing protein n=1 Tax=Fusarium flagelliforme TaxID=2675880 RepID=A0A395N1K2_9HYPO|nr:hypothetical protein FIE12Z_1748 [Fusarium flagelliforme]